MTELRLISLRSLIADAHAEARLEAAGGSIAELDPNDAAFPLAELPGRYARSGAPAPRLLDRRAWTLNDVDLPATTKPGADRERYEPRAFQTWLFGFPRGGLVLGVVIDLAANLYQLRSAMVDTFWKHEKIRLGGQPLLEALADAVPSQVEPLLRGASLGGDVHELVVLPDLALVAGEPEEGVSRDERALRISSEALRKIIHRSERTSYRPELDVLDLPAAGNRVPGTLTVVSESVSVYVRQDAHYEHGLALSIAQIICGLGRARQIHTAVKEVASGLTTLHADKPSQNLNELRARRCILGDFWRRLSELELDLDLGVDANADIGLVAQARWRREFHTAVAHALGLDTVAAGASRSIERVRRAVEAEWESVAAEENRVLEQAQTELLNQQVQLVNTTEAAKTAAFVVGVVAAIVTGIGLFAALASIPRPARDNPTVLLSPALIAAAVAGLAIVGAGVTGWSLWRLARWHAPKKLRPAFLAGGIGSTIAATALFSFGLNSSGLTADLIPVGLVTLFAALVLFAAWGTFEHTPHEG
ncbi:MAG TPA: hypothetical protein VNJ54_08745 [Plantibacter sp.]|uniref:hypothetical protein n=1 Tax=Plantibacter sp. TaxID=1871045 RepID=UPI002BA06B18|nr:hypothetical protein [Plantibacter sp.]